MGAGTYLKGIDGLRAIAVLAVIAYHVDILSILPGGFSGVDVFFVISGYVISKSLARQSDVGFLRFLSGFYSRRIRRIVPALMVCLLATILASVLFVPTVWNSRELQDAGLAAFFGLSNFVLASAGQNYFSPGVDLNPYLHTWSLGVEEQFYLLFPALMFVWLRWRRTAGALGWFAWLSLPALALISLGFAFVETTNAPGNAFYLLPSRFWELAAGALLFQAHDSRRLLPQSRLMGVSTLAAGLILTLLGFLFTSEAHFPFPAALLPVAGAALMIAAIAGGSGGVLQNVLGSGPLAYIGRISYSLYLWHWPVIVLARWTVGFESPLVLIVYLPLVFGLAALSYHFVEMPIRSGAWIRARANWVQIASGLASVVVFWGAAGQLVDAKETITLSTTKDVEMWRSIGWGWPRDLSELVGDADLSGRKLFSFGDSHSAAYRTMLKEVSGNLGIEIVEHEEGDCPYPSLLAPRSDYEHCDDYFQEAIADIKANARPGDFVLLAGLRMPELNGTDQDGIVKEARQQVAPARISAALQDGIAAMAALEVPGVHFIIDAPAPVMKAPAYRCSDWFNGMNPVCASGLSVDRALLEELRAPVLASMRTLAARFDNLTIWDPFPILCPPGATCSAYDDGQPLYFDSDHLSGHGNRVLTPSFIETLIALS